MDLVSVSITTHVYAIMALVLIMIFNYSSVCKVESFVNLAKRLRLMTPLYHMANAFVVYTGAIVAAYIQEFSLTIILMIATSLLVMILEIKRYKRMRVIKTEEVEKQQEFRVYAKKLYTISIMAVVLTYVISKLF